MDAISRSATLIANKAFRFGGRAYEPGDRFDWRRLAHSSRRKVNVMIDGANRQIVELSPTTMASALKRRDRGSRPPRGFTLAGLQGLNLITEEQIALFGWTKDQEEGVQDEGTADLAPEGWTPPENSIQVGNIWIVQVKTRGGPKRFDILNAEGERLLPGGTIAGLDNAKDKAAEFNQQLAANQGADQHAEAVDTEHTFADHPLDEDDWSEDQVLAFNKWYDELEPDAQVALANPVAVMFFNRRKREAEKPPVEPPAGEGSQQS